MTTLKQDIENLPQELEAIGEYYYAAIVRGLVKKVEGLQADAERYRFIRDRLEGTMLVVNELQDEAPSKWGAAIDVARKAK